jgi:phage/plasmid-associated DNA primase
MSATTTRLSASEPAAVPSSGLSADQVQEWLARVQEDLRRVQARLEYLRAEQERLENQQHLLGELLAASTAV